MLSLLVDGVVLLWWCGVAGDGMMVWWRDGVMVLL